MRFFHRGEPYKGPCNFLSELVCSRIASLLPGLHSSQNRTSSGTARKHPGPLQIRTVRLRIVSNGPLLIPELTVVPPVRLSAHGLAMDIGAGPGADLSDKGLKNPAPILLAAFRVQIREDNRLILRTGRSEKFPICELVRGHTDEALLGVQSQERLQIHRSP